MAHLTFKLNSNGKTTVRISKKFYPYEFIQFLKTKSDFEYKETNKINHVFVYLGTVGNAEFYLKTHWLVFRNMNNKLKMS
jgi:hypothetical protein